MEQQIYIAISNAMSEIGAIGKDSKNTQQNFKYRGIDAVMNALQPVLVNNKIFAIPEVLEQAREEKTTKAGGNLTYSILKVKYTFYASDGSNVSAIVIGEGMDSADKSSNKAMSAAFKYACFQVLCIPTEETNPDADGETHDLAPTEKPSAIPKPIICKECNQTVNDGKNGAGEIVLAKDFYKQSSGLCAKCYKKQREAANG